MSYANEPLAVEEWLNPYEKEVKGNNELAIELKLERRLNGSEVASGFVYEVFTRRTSQTEVSPRVKFDSIEFAHHISKSTFTFIRVRLVGISYSPPI